ncbi:MAG: hypothetical protein ACEPOZ_15335 [Marinifilaceae bacterium]
METTKETEKLQIAEFIIDFYRLQPGVKGEILEKLEVFMVLMNSHYFNVMEEAESLTGLEAGELPYAVVEVLNGYLNALGEEFERIFSETENPFLLIPVFEGINQNFPAFMETLNVWNGLDKDLFGIQNQLNRLEESYFEDDVNAELILEVLSEVIEQIHLKMVNNIEDLL